MVGARRFPRNIKVQRARQSIVWGRCTTTVKSSRLISPQTKHVDSKSLQIKLQLRADNSTVTCQPTADYIDQG